MEAKRVQVFQTHEQLDSELEYEGKLLGISVDNAACIVQCDDGKLTAPYITLCKILA